MRPASLHGTTESLRYSLLSVLRSHFPLVEIRQALRFEITSSRRFSIWKNSRGCLFMSDDGGTGSANALAPFSYFRAAVIARSGSLLLSFSSCFGKKKSCESCWRGMRRERRRSRGFPMGGGAGGWLRSGLKGWGSEKLNTLTVVRFCQSPNFKLIELSTVNCHDIASRSRNARAANIAEANVTRARDLRIINVKRK